MRDIPHAPPNIPRKVCQALTPAVRQDVAPPAPQLPCPCPQGGRPCPSGTLAAPSWVLGLGSAFWSPGAWSLVFRSGFSILNWESPEWSLVLGSGLQVLQLKFGSRSLSLGSGFVVPGSRCSIGGLGCHPGFWGLGSGSEGWFLSLLRPLLASHHGCVTAHLTGSPTSSGCGADSQPVDGSGVKGRPELRWQQVGLGATTGCTAVLECCLRSPGFLSVSNSAPHISPHPTPWMEFGKVS